MKKWEIVKLMMMMMNTGGGGGVRNIKKCLLDVLEYVGILNAKS